MDSEAARDINDEDIGTGGFLKAFTAASALVDAAALPPGRYYMYSTTDVWVKRGPLASVTAAKAIASEFLLKAGVYWPVRVTVPDAGTRDAFAVIRDSADGTIYFFRVDRNGP